MFNENNSNNSSISNNSNQIRKIRQIHRRRSNNNSRLRLPEFAPQSTRIAEKGD